MQIALYVIIAVLVVLTFLPATGKTHWFFRTPDFLRSQLITVQILTLLLLILFSSEHDLIFFLFTAALLWVILYQTLKIIPYTLLYSRRKNSLDTDGQVSILAANVLQTNRNFNEFISLIELYDPDLIVTMETDKLWERGLAAIESTYTESVKVPLANYYGMHVYSRLPLKSVSIKYLIEEDVPSIHFEVPLKNKSIYFACLHPAPPSPTENTTSSERDAELMLVGKEIRNKTKSAVVCGDMNDVVWSRTSRLFRNITGMVDPRIGRGFFSTYHAKYWFFRFPLDHLFHTRDLIVGKMERSKYFGSDHFAMYYEIHYQTDADIPENPEFEQQEAEEVDQIIDQTETNS